MNLIKFLFVILGFLLYFEGVICLWYTELCFDTRNIFNVKKGMLSSQVGPFCSSKAHNQLENRFLICHMPFNGP